MWSTLPDVFAWSSKALSNVSFNAGAWVRHNPGWFVDDQAGSIFEENVQCLRLPVEQHGRRLRVSGGRCHPAEVSDLVWRLDG